MTIKEVYFGLVARAYINKDISAMLVLEQSISICADSKTVTQAVNDITDYRDFIRKSKTKIFGMQHCSPLRFNKGENQSQE
jgi:hypothetical protein